MKTSQITLPLCPMPASRRPFLTLNSLKGVVLRAEEILGLPLEFVRFMSVIMNYWALSGRVNYIMINACLYELQ